MKDHIKHLYEVFGEDVILLAVPFGTKRLTRAEWQKTTLEKTRSKEYQLELERSNIGVLLGRGLVDFDIDDDAEIEPFLIRNPWARETLRTKGKRGCHFWARVQGVYEEKRIVLKEVGKKVKLEYRGGGGHYSVVWGPHPDGGSYSILVDCPVAIVEWSLIKAYITECRFDMVSNWDEDDMPLDERQTRVGTRDYTWLRDEFARCDLKELDLRGLLKELGYGSRSTSEATKFAIRCIWSREHGGEGRNDGNLDAAIWQSGRYWPAFKCFHAHCAERGLRDILEWAEEQSQGIVERFCNLRTKRKAIRNADSYMKIYQEQVNEGDVLLGDRWLCRGSGGFIIAPTGAGKSVLVAQCAISWAMGREAFGIRPSRPLVSLVLQTEDDRGDLIEQARMIQYMGVSEDEGKLIDQNTFVASPATFGTEFAMQFPEYLEIYHPDIVWLNPYGAFSPSLMDEGENSHFLRQLIAPWLQRYKCGLIAMHHTPKTGSRDTSNWDYIDYSYAGAGWAVMSNWARAYMAIEAVKGVDNMFKFIAAKRGQRIGWIDKRIRYFNHSEIPGKLMWIESLQQDIDAVSKVKAKGRPQSQVVVPMKYNLADMLALLVQPLTWTEWISAAMVGLGMSEKTAKRKIAELKQMQKVKIVGERYIRIEGVVD